MTTKRCMVLLTWIYRIYTYSEASCRLSLLCLLGSKPWHAQRMHTCPWYCVPDPGFCQSRKEKHKPQENWSAPEFWKGLAGKKPSQSSARKWSSERLFSQSGKCLKKISINWFVDANPQKKFQWETILQLTNHHSIFWVQSRTVYWARNPAALGSPIS